MEDDLAYVRARIPEYGDYGDETSRHQTDMYVRAFVGERLNDARLRLVASLDERTTKTLDELILHCQFTDQTFIHWLDHARIDPPIVATLVRLDRQLIEAAQQVETATAAELPALLQTIDIAFEHRREPLPA